MASLRRHRAVGEQTRDAHCPACRKWTTVAADKTLVIPHVPRCPVRLPAEATRTVRAIALDVGDRLLFPIMRLVDGEPTVSEFVPATVTQKSGGMTVCLDEETRPADRDAYFRVMPHDTVAQLLEVPDAP